MEFIFEADMGHITVWRLDAARCDRQAALQRQSTLFERLERSDPFPVCIRLLYSLFQFPNRKSFCVFHIRVPVGGGEPGAGKGG